MALVSSIIIILRIYVAKLGSQTGQIPKFVKLRHMRSYLLFSVVHALKTFYPKNLG